MKFNISIDLFGQIVQPEVKLKNKSGGFIINPCIAVFGKGPEKTRCKSCVHFIRKQYRGTYFKCKFRGDTNGPGTDHRANWPTCGRFILETNAERDEK
jgi:hypothetical protein